MTSTFSPAFGFAAIDRVAADRERLDEGALLGRELVGEVQLAGRKDDPLGACRRRTSRRASCGSRSNWCGRAGRSSTVWQLMYGSTEQRSPGFTFVTPSPTASTSTPSSWPGNARVAEERHLAEVAAEVGAADADALHADERLAGAGLRRLGDFDLSPRLWLLELEGFHEWVQLFSGSPSVWPMFFTGAKDRLHLAQQFLVDRLRDPLGPLANVLRVRRAGDRGGDVRIGAGETALRALRCRSPVAHLVEEWFTTLEPPEIVQEDPHDARRWCRRSSPSCAG